MRKLGDCIQIAKTEISMHDMITDQYLVIHFLAVDVS